ncbi:hypothetical protein PSPO01_15828 [Paraphaeosphaeria sporulosa]
MKSPTPFADLKSFALVSREITPLAQEEEVLHRAPEVDNYPIQHQVFHMLTKQAVPQASAVFTKEYQLSQFGVRSKSFLQKRIAQLDWTLKTRPLLAQKVRALEILLIGRPNVINSFATQDIWNPAIDMSMLLDKVPRLESLVLKLAPPFEIPKSVCIRPPPLAGFSNLKSLTTNFLPPWQILVLPTLRSLHIDARALEPGPDSQPEVLDPFQKRYLGDGIAASESSEIINLVLDLDVDILNAELAGIENNEACKALADLPYILKALESLQLRLCYAGESRDHTVVAEHSYHKLMPFFFQKGLRTVMIDTCDVNWAKYHNSGNDFQHADLRVHNVIAEEIDTLYDPVNEDGSRHSNEVADLLNFTSPTPLPPSVESIEIVSPTRALNRWAKYILENPTSYPNLKEVVFWCDTRHTSLVFGYRFWSQGKPHVDGSFNRWEDNVSDTVWDELQENGISLVIHEEPTRGWREDT